MSNLQRFIKKKNQLPKTVVIQGAEGASQTNNSF